MVIGLVSNLIKSNFRLNTINLRLIETNNINKNKFDYIIINVSSIDELQSNYFTLTGLCIFAYAFFSLSWNGKRLNNLI